MKNKLLTTWIIRTTAASVITFCVTSLAAGQTRLHPDLGGVSLKLDRLQLSVRLDGRVTTSVPVANKWFYQSNYGFGGTYWSYGREDNGSLPLNILSVDEALIEQVKLAGRLL